MTFACPVTRTVSDGLLTKLSVTSPRTGRVLSDYDDDSDDMICPECGSTIIHEEVDDDGAYWICEKCNYFWDR